MGRRGGWTGGEHAGEDAGGRGKSAAFLYGARAHMRFSSRREPITAEFATSSGLGATVATIECSDCRACTNLTIAPRMYVLKSFIFCFQLNAFSFSPSPLSMPPPAFSSCILV